MYRIDAICIPVTVWQNPIGLISPLDVNRDYKLRFGICGTLYCTDRVMHILHGFLCLVTLTPFAIEHTHTSKFQCLTHTHLEQS